jgi:cytochrome b6-f complex iron-sulfur subunit
MARGEPVTVSRDEPAVPVSMGDFMRSTVWVVDPAQGRARADAIVESLRQRGVPADVRTFVDGPAVVVEDAPASLETPDGVIRAATVELPGDAGMTRRALLDLFAGALVVAAGAAAVGAVAGFAAPPEGRREDVSEIEAASFAELKAKGVMRFRFGREPCILVFSEGTIHALSLVCTHLGCLVEWNPERRQLTCPCHRAAFGLQGNVIEGPPPRPLPTFNVSLVGDRVLVRRRTA